MDRQVKAERAWSIPYKIKEIIGSFEMADVFYSTVPDIANKYEGGASKFKVKFG